ncbi:MAG: LPS export ABC transporter permease LptG [Bdellovibrionota bacterium]|jgi:lipopolysaccharide export system permease protein
MTIIQRYVFKEVVHYLIIASIALCTLFLVVDFFDRIDNIIGEDASIFIVMQYFLLKIPQIFTLTLPLAMIVAVMLGIGLLAKNSEITAMRASGMKVFWIAKPIFILAFGLSIIDLIVSETLVPHCTRRVREIYNIDIKEKHKTGTFSQDDFWLREGNKFYSIAMFDSRNNTLHSPTLFEVDDNFYPRVRTDADRAVFVKDGLGWTMFDVIRYKFLSDNEAPLAIHERSLPLPIQDRPQDFYNVETDPFTMSYFQLKAFIEKQIANGLAANGYLTDLYSKAAFPFVILISALVVLPFSLKPSRTGNMAISFIAGLLVSFTYYAVHSFSLAMGRAEIWPPLLAAWVGNILMLVVALILNIGAESPE